jgi:hypothetical protein
MKHSAEVLPAQKLSRLQPRVDASIAASKETTARKPLLWGALPDLAVNGVAQCLHNIA